MRVQVAYRGLGAGGTSGGAARGAILRGRFVVSNRLEVRDRRTTSQTQQTQTIINLDEAATSYVLITYIIENMNTTFT